MSAASAKAAVEASKQVVKNPQVAEGLMQR
jgi:hypothetical protein